MFDSVSGRMFQSISQSVSNQSASELMNLFTHSKTCQSILVPIHLLEKVVCFVQSQTKFVHYKKKCCNQLV